MQAYNQPQTSGSVKTAQAPECRPWCRDGDCMDATDPEERICSSEPAYVEFIAGRRDLAGGGTEPDWFRVRAEYADELGVRRVVLEHGDDGEQHLTPAEALALAAALTSHAALLWQP